MPTLKQIRPKSRKKGCTLYFHEDQNHKAALFHLAWQGLFSMNQRRLLWHMCPPHSAVSKKKFHIPFFSEEWHISISRCLNLSSILNNFYREGWSHHILTIHLVYDQLIHGSYLAKSKTGLCWECKSEQTWKNLLHLHILQWPGQLKEFTIRQC